MNERFAFIFRGKELLVPDRTGMAPPTESEALLLGTITAGNLYPGTRGPIRYLSASAPADLLEAPPGWRFAGLRSLIISLPREIAAAMAHANQILEWRSNNQYCGHCGFAMVDAEEEIARKCPSCGMIVYPRISPAIIVGILREDSILLARNAKRKNPLYSLIAGFVEPGETLEDAVAREVFEEVSIGLKNIRYFASQPWPFPDSLMVGFLADYASGEIAEDGVEIVDAGWYTPEAFPQIPPGGTISRKIINWYEKEYRSRRE